jgi:hypothetical protein
MFSDMRTSSVDPPFCLRSMISRAARTPGFHFKSSSEFLSVVMIFSMYDNVLQNKLTSEFPLDEAVIM